jgi:hypothetical protein
VAKLLTAKTAMVLPLFIGFIFGFDAIQNAAAQTPSPDRIWRFGSSDTVSGALFETNNLWDSTYENWQQWKKQHDLPITVGAYNWYHVNNGGPAPSGYGEPGLRDTYFWYLATDPYLTLSNAVVQGVGADVEARFRESSDKFRSYFYNAHAWVYQGYGYVDTPIGRFKAGQIRQRFGLDWDDTWWGDVQYFDGFKLNTGYGLSSENTWHEDDSRFKLDSFVQYFAREADISGSKVGANPESVPGAQERNVGDIRLVPTWQLSHDSSLALGISGLAGEIRNVMPGSGDTSQLAWAADATYTWQRFKVFGEVDRSFGVLNPARYVSGGPSDHITDPLAGVEYKYGPATFRLAWSAGFDANPSGHQYLWVPGITQALTKNTTFYVEYVNWQVTNKLGERSPLENGFQLVLNWHL